MSSKRKRIPRRKSQILDSRSQVSSSEPTDCDGSDELKQLYRNKDYKPPEIKQFETIFEPSSKVRRGLIEDDGTLKVGKGLGHRFIDFASLEYWRCDNKERNKRRKAMVTKQFKGRKRNKAEPLSDKAYDELFEMIANKEDSIIESDSEQDNGETKSLNDSLLYHPVETKRANGSSSKTDLCHDNNNVNQPEKCSDTKKCFVQSVCKPSVTSLSPLPESTESSSPTSYDLSSEVRNSSPSKIETLPSSEVIKSSPSTIETLPSLEVRNLSPTPIDTLPSSEVRKLSPSAIEILPSSEVRKSSPSMIEILPSSEVRKSSPTTIETLLSFEVRNSSPTPIEIAPEDQNKMCLSVQGSNCVRRSARIKSKSEDMEFEIRGRKNGQHDRSRSANEISVLGSILVAGENPGKRRRFRKDFLSVGDCEVFESQDNMEKIGDSNDSITNAKVGLKDKIDEHLDLAEAVESKECRNSDEDFDDEESIPSPSVNKRRSITYKDLSGLGLTFGYAGGDIAMPAVVRRSLSGEIVVRRSGEFGGNLISTEDDIV